MSLFVNPKIIKIVTYEYTWDSNVSTYPTYYPQSN